MGNASTCCSHPIVQNKDTLIPFQKNMLVNEDCDVHEWEADDFVKIGLQNHPVKEHKLFDQPSVIRRMESVEAPKLGQRLDAFPEIENQIVRTVLNQLPPLILPQDMERGEENPPIKFDNDFIYHGEWKDSQKHGYGKLLWPDGSYYEGGFVNNETSGFGRLIHSFGDYYEGSWKHDQANGYGKYHRYRNQATYEGNWVNDKQQGQGKETWQDGSSYEGEYLNGKKQGRGMFKWGNGNMYLGDFKNNKMDGHGVYYWKSGKVYDGEWKENRMDGEGSFNWPDGRKYKGGYTQLLIMHILFKFLKLNQLFFITEYSTEKINSKYSFFINCIRMILKKVMECLNGRMDVITKGNGNKANNMAREFSEWINRKKQLLNGSMAKCSRINKLSNKLQVHDTFYIQKQQENQLLLNSQTYASKLDQLSLQILLQYILLSYSIRILISYIKLKRFTNIKQYRINIIAIDNIMKNFHIEFIKQQFNIVLFQYFKSSH